MMKRGRCAERFGLAGLVAGNRPRLLLFGAGGGTTYQPLLNDPNSAQGSEPSSPRRTISAVM